MRTQFCQAMIVSAVCALDLKAAIEAETEATYSMVLPGSIPSPIAAQTTTIEVINGTVAPVIVRSEDMTGNGMDYRGAQTMTRDGIECQKWSE